MAGEMNTSDVELVVGLDLMLGNENEFVEELSKFQDTDIKLNINGTDKNLSEIATQLMQILQGEEDVAKKSKTMATALGNDAKNIKTVFEQIIKQITSNLQNMYEASSNSLQKGKIADYYSQLNSMKDQANILQGIVRRYEEVFDKLDTIEINNKFYDRSNLNGFIQDLDKAATEQKKYLSGSSKLKKELENAATKAKEDIVKNPAMSSVIKNTIATLGKEFKLLDDEITKNISDKNYDGLSDKIKKLYQLKTAIKELMTQSGIETVKQQDTPLNVSVKKDTKHGINTRFDSIISQVSKIKSSEIETLIKQINKGAINADENIQALIEDCFKLNQSVNANNTTIDTSTSLTSTVKNEASKISKEDKDLLDEAIEGLSISKASDFPEALKILVDQFNKMAQINFDDATKILTQKLRKEEFIDKKQTLKDFEDIYKKDLSNLGVSFYKPDENIAQILTASSTQNIDDSVLQAATEAQKQAEAEAQQYKAEIDSLNSQIVAKDKELEALSKKVNELQIKLNKVSEDSSKEDVSKLKAEIEIKNKEKIALEKEIQDLRSKASSTQSETKSEDNSAKVKKMQQELSNKTKENNALKKSNEELNAVIGSTPSTISASNANTGIDNKAIKSEAASTVTEISKAVNPLQITDITVTEQAKTKLKAEVNNAIATIYVSDVKLADGVLLSELQKEISTILNTNPVEVQITPKFDNAPEINKDDNAASLPNGVSINISSIDFANEEVLGTIRSRIEQALIPIFIQKVDGEKADISSLENKIALALNVIKIDRVELNDNFDIKPLQRDIEKYISKIKLSKIDSKDLAKAIKDEVEKAIKELKSPEFEVKAKITNSEAKQFDKLTKTIDKVTTSITNKNDAIKKEKELVNEGVTEEIGKFQELIEKIVALKNTIGTIKKIRVYFEKEETDNNEKKEQDSTKPKTKRKTQKQVTGTVNDSDNSENKTEEKKEVLTKSQKKKLLEEELKLETKIAKIKYQINKETSKNDKADNQRIEKLKEELNITEQIKENLVDHQKNGITSEDVKDFIDVQEKKVNTAINNEANAINKGQKNIGIENTQEARKSFSDVQKAMEEYNSSGEKTIETLGKLKAVSQEVINTNQAVRSQISNSTGENALNNKYERLITKMKKWAADNPLALKDNDISNTYTNILKQLEDTSKRSADEIARLESEFNKLDGQIRETGQTGRTFTGEMKNLFSILGDRALVGTLIQSMRDGLRQMVTNVKEIDRAMTELKKVTDETSKSYNNFLKEAGTRAEALGTTMTDLISSTADFAKLGYSLKDAAILAENAIMYSNVGDLDIQTATSDLVSATKAFGIEAENVTKIVDSFNEVGNNYAVSAQQIGEALQNSASSLVVAGNDIDQSIAMITAMTEITQDASSAGIDLPDNMVTY